MSSRSEAAEWWQGSLQEMGVQGMEKLLPPDAGWDEVLASGREDLARGIALSGMRTGSERTVVEIGCGVGRMSQALGERFGTVVGLDIAPGLLEKARAQNRNPRVSFAPIDGRRVTVEGASDVDTVFSYEVLYYIPPETVRQYFRDAHALLRDGGEFAFQINLSPLTWKTRASYACRRLLFACGVRTWRGWPTSPAFQRHGYTAEWVTAALRDAGFEVTRTALDSPKQAWFLATRPGTSDAGR